MGVPVKKGKKNNAAVHDLDLDVPVVDDLSIVHNAKSQKAQRRLKSAYEVAEIDEDDENFGVLPNEAHDIDDTPHTLDDLQEDAENAIKISRKHRKALADDDFGLGALPTPAQPKSSAAPKSSELDAATAALEEVERDFAKLTSAERLAMLKSESPEVLALLEELGEKIDAAGKLTADLKSARFKASKSGRDQELVDYLETKTTLMLTYCAHVTFYLLLKAEGAKINNHPVVDRLVELRVYLEKLRPVEQRLQYSLNKLLAGGVNAGPKVSNLRPVSEYDGELFQANKTKAVDDARAQRRKAVARLAQHEALEREEEANMTRAMKKGVMRDGDLELINAADPGMEEDQDQFLSNMVDYDSDDDAGLSLIDKLRQKVSQTKLSSNAKKPKTKKPAVDEDENWGEEDEYNEDDADGFNYDDLVDEEQTRQAARESAPKRPKYVEEEEVSRRKIDQKILTHRGLTEVRPKDKKNPRVNRRVKARKGEQEANAQSRVGKKAERGDQFVGVPALKTHVTHTKRLA